MTNQEAISVLESINAKTDYFLINDDARTEALDMAIFALRVPDGPDINVGSMISRQAAIDIERTATVDTNPSHFEAHQKFIQFMDDAEISSFGRWQWSNGFNTALTAIEIDLKKLPSAEPERKTGKWLSENRTMDAFWVCSVCGFPSEAHAANIIYNYCPNCGAYMRGE